MGRYSEKQGIMSLSIIVQDAITEYLRAKGANLGPADKERWGVCSSLNERGENVTRTVFWEEIRRGLEDDRFVDKDGGLTYTLRSDEDQAAEATPHLP